MMAQHGVIDLEPYRAAFAAARETLPGGGWLAERRSVALNRFLSLGIPTPKAEDWRYADLRALRRSAFAHAEEAPPAEPRALERLMIEGLDGPRLVFVNGRLDRARSRLSRLGKGVHLRSLREVLLTGGQSLKGLIADLESADALAALNTAMMRDGYVIEIANGVVLEAPIEIVHLSQDAADRGVHLRHVIRLGSGAKASVVETYGGDASGYFLNALGQITLADGAHLKLLRRQREGAAALHLARSFAILGKARLDMHLLSTGAASARSELRAEFTTEGGAVSFDAIQLAGEGQTLDCLSFLDHAVPGCSSAQRYRGVLAGAARASFSGKVLVEKGAQKTAATQQARSLLLDAGAEANTKPELEIYADDVICSHGATMGAIDPAQLFYLMARGLDEQAARALLVEAFVGELLADLPPGPLADVVRADAAAWLGGLSQEGR
ncbi:MAG: Fe-S cluster assembly protein SufD [Rhodothalassiaceae bacterium]